MLALSQLPFINQKPSTVKALVSLLSFWSLLVVALFLIYSTEVDAKVLPAKRLIEFGWDEPDAAFLRSHIQTMEKTAFNGCVFHVNYRDRDGGTGNFSVNAWGRRAYTAEELQAAIHDLNATRFHHFRHNFLHFNVTPADIDWFDDFASVISNAKLAARIARSAKAKGILLDVEQYKFPLFNYHQQRNASSRSWREYSEQVSKRGREVMAAFESEFPGITVFLTYGYTLPWEESQEGRRPLSDIDYGLLVPFLDGMLDSARGKSRIVDGYEFAYSILDPNRFRAAYQEMSTNVLRLVLEPKRYKKFFRFSFGIWLDADWGKRGWHPDRIEENVHSPQAFEELLKRALAVADEYVWVYSESAKWWSKEDGSNNIPEVYKEALARAAEIEQAR